MLHGMSTPASKPHYKVALIGCGRPHRSEGATGYGMAHRHMAGFTASGRCTLVAVANRTRERGEEFIAVHNPKAAVYTDYLEMMQVERPDVVSVCLWPAQHAEVVCRLAEFQPKLIFCEKPMDIHWDSSLRMHEVCRQHGVVLIINHQRRFNLPLARAKALLDAGEIGALQRMEGAWYNIADAGSHVLDLLFFYNNDTAADWVLGQIDLREPQIVFGALHAGHGVSEIRFKNGVRAIFRFGKDHVENGCLLRLSGERGQIEILFNEPWLRIRRAGQAEWEIVDTGESIHDDKAIHRAIAEMLDCLETGAVSQLDSTRALRATEVIFATHESSRRRGRVDLPLAAVRCAMLEMVASGELKVG